MPNTRRIFDEALDRLKDYSGLPINVEIKRSGENYIVIIGKNRFVTTVRTAISNGNKIIAYARLPLGQNKSGLPLLIISGYIPVSIAKEYANAGINYLDVAGNCHIRYKNLSIIIEGKKRTKIPNTNQSRAFQEAGVKIIFELLTDPSKVQLPYRKLADLAKVSLGSVGSVMKELIDLDFILETENRKALKNTSVLLDRWITAYHDVLRPRLFLKKTKFINSKQSHNWGNILSENGEKGILWGGEPAAALLTRYLSPEKFTLYTNDSWQEVMKTLKLVPDDNGDIEILEIFWGNHRKDMERDTVPPLLIYADLMGSRIGRNIETAKKILENELSYIVSRV